MKKILFLLIVAALAISCNKSDSDDGITTINLYSGLWNNVEEVTYIRSVIIPEFEENNPDIKIQLDIAVSGEEMKKFFDTQKRSDNWSIDLAIVHSGDMPTYIRNDWIMDIDFIKDNLDYTFIEAFDASTNMNGKSYFLPISADVYLTIANKAAFDYLPEGATPENLTWDQYAEWSNIIGRSQGPKTVVSYEPIKALLYQIAGIGISYGAGFPEINTPPMRKAWDIAAQISGDIVPDSAIVSNPVDLIKNDSGWLTFHHMVDIGKIYSSAPAKYRVLPAPSGTAGRGSVAGSWGVGLTPNYKEKSEEIERFIHWFLSPEVLLDIVSGTGGTIPPVEEVVNLLGGSATDLIIQEGLKTLQMGIVSGVPGSDYTDWSAVKGIFDDVFETVISSGEVDPAVLDAAQKKLEALEIR